MTTINIKTLSKLAEMPISETEAQKLEKELETTLQHVERLNDIDTSHVEGTNEVTDVVDVMREDVAKPSLTQAEALMNAKRVHNGFFVVPVIIEEAVE